MYLYTLLRSRMRKIKLTGLVPAAAAGIVAIMLAWPIAGTAGGVAAPGLVIAPAPAIIMPMAAGTVAIVPPPAAAGIVAAAVPPAVAGVPGS